MSELMPKAPEGYHELVGADREKFLNTGMAITLIQFKIAQHNAELEAAKANLELAQSRIRDAQREMQIALQQRDDVDVELKIVDPKKDVIANDPSGKIYIVDRPADWKRPEKKKIELRSLPGGKFEVVEVQPPASVPPVAVPPPPKAETAPPAPPAVPPSPEPEKK